MTSMLFFVGMAIKSSNYNQETEHVICKALWTIPTAPADIPFPSMIAARSSSWQGKGWCYFTVIRSTCGIISKITGNRKNTEANMMCLV